MKIVSSGKGIHSQGFYEKKRRARKIKFVVSSFGIITFLIISVFVSRHDRFLVSEVLVSGDGGDLNNEIIKSVEEVTSGRYLWIIPKMSTFLYPRQEIESKLAQEFPRFKSTKLNIDNFQVLNIAVTAREPFARYCATSEECYLLDENGFIFSVSPTSDESYLTYSLEEVVDSPVGKSLLPEETFTALSKFIDSLSELGIIPVALKINKVHYVLSLTNGAEILWQRGSEPALVKSNLSAFLANDTIRARGDFWDKILYLDLRTENKVFYKFRE